MRRHRIRTIAFLCILGSLSFLTETSRAGTDPALDAAVARLKPGQRLHVRTNDYVMIRGRFLLAAPDSIFIKMRFPENKSLGEPGVTTMVGIGNSQVDVMWAFERRGVGHGLLWAGGALLAGGVVMLAGAGDSLGDAMFVITVTAVAVPTAFLWGMFGTEEKKVYSRH